MKPKQPLATITTSTRNINSNYNKNPTVRKPSLPIKRASSVQSCLSDQSCMSDRVVYASIEQSKRVSGKDKDKDERGSIDAGRCFEK